MRQFRLHTRVRLGIDSLSALDEFAGDRVFVVTDEFLSGTPLFAEVCGRLGNPPVFNQVLPNPTVTVVARGLASYLEAKPDVIVAYGGGSVLDAAKAIHKAAIETGQAGKYGLVAVPTTSGSGSEVTSYAVITDESTHSKMALVSPDLVAGLAILDPATVQGVPPKVTADSGMDVLTHACEAYVALTACDFTDALVEKAVQLVFGNLVRCYTHGDDLDARAHMHNASCLAAMAFDNVGLGITHSLAHALGGRYPIAHGRLNAILLPEVIAYNAERSPRAAERYALLGRLIAPSAVGQAAVIALIAAVRKLNTQLQIPQRVSQAGAESADLRANLDELAATALDDSCTASNPVVPTTAELAQILRAVI